MENTTEKREEINIENVSAGKVHKILDRPVLSAILLLVFALFKRKWECEVAEETMFLIDRTIRRSERPAGPYPAQSSPK